MKVYISADIEGVVGVSHWDEATIGKPGYDAAAARLTAEVAAACEAAIDAGADEILVQDAHDSARNIDHAALPERVRLVRGWSDDPRCMAQELDASFDALVLIGQHAASGTGGNPLAHTFSLANSRLSINGEIASEYLVLRYTAAYYGVPLAFVSGDAWVAAQARRLEPGVEALAVKEGRGNSTIDLHPAAALRGIREGVARGLARPSRLELPPSFDLRIAYQHHGRPFKTAFYPGVEKSGDRELRFVSSDFYELLRMLLFVGY
jgi:D-amino peptidase